MRRGAPIVAVGALALVSAFATEAHARERVQFPAETPASHQTAPATAPARRVWYGAEIIPFDVLALAAPFIALGSKDPGVATVAMTAGMLSYYAGGPIVHGINRRRAGVVAGSVGMRFGVPLLGALVGAGAASSAVNDCKSASTSPFDALCGLAALTGIAVGFYAGMAIASVLDIAALAWKDPNSVPDAPADPAQPVHVVPTFGMTAGPDAHHRAPMFGVAGSF